MATVGISKARINGVVDTTATALENLTEIAFNAGAWMTWDPTLGKWSVIVNESQSLGGVRIFDDSNIIGSINMTFSGAESMYNSVRINYPHKDLRNARDEIYFSLNAGDRYFGEYDNELSIQTNLITDPVQAAYIGTREMKQSRIDAIVEFKTDYTAMDLEVGEVFLLKNDIYNFNNGSGEYFRCVNIEELDTEEGGIVLSVTGLQYDGSIYTQSGLTREERNLNSGIKPAQNNVCKVTNDKETFANRTADALATDAGRAAITGAGVPIFETLSLTESGATIENIFESAYTAGALYFDETAPAYSDPTTYPYYYGFTWSLNPTIKTMVIDFDGAQATMNYTVDGSAKQITAGVPCKLDLFYRIGGVGSWNHAAKKFMEWSSYITSFVISDINVENTSWLLLVTPLNTYDLNASNNYVTPTSFNGANAGIITDAAGDAGGITISLFLN